MGHSNKNAWFAHFLQYKWYYSPFRRILSIVQISVYRSVRYACVGRGYDPADHVECLSCQISVTGSRLPCYCEERSDAPQGGRSCPLGAIHLLAISCRNVRSQKDSGIGIFFNGISISVDTNSNVIPGDCHGPCGPRNDIFFTFFLCLYLLVDATLSAES